MHKATDLASTTLLDDANLQRRHLEKDKSFLEQEVSNLRSKLDEKCRQCERASAKIASLDLKVSELTDQLATLQLKSKSDFEMKMEKEVSRVREESLINTQMVKEATITAFETRIGSLSETVSSLSAENDKLRRQLDNKISENSQIRMEFNHLHIQKSNEVNELRSELKLKAFEVSTVCAKYEDTVKRLRTMETDAQLMKQELDAHKTSIMMIENERNLRIANMQHAIDSMSKRLQIYDALEKDIDDSENNLINHLAQCPELRIRQTVLLTQKLVASEKLIKSLTQSLEDALRSKEKYETEIVKLKEDFERLSKPTSYLLVKLREEEANKHNWIMKHNDVYEKMTMVYEENKILKLEVEKMSEKLSSILQQRSEIAVMQELIESWQEVCEKSTNTAEFQAEMAQPVLSSFDRNPPKPFSRKVESLVDLGLSPSVVVTMLKPPE